MPKYKVLKSVAHNLGHSFLSDMNTVDGFNSWVPELLLSIAEAHDSPTVDIDFLEGTVAPEPFSTPEVLRSVRTYRDQLPKLVESQGASWHSVRGTTLKLTFDLSRVVQIGADPRHRRPELECVVRVLDDRGVSHEGRPQHWWV